MIQNFKKPAMIQKEPSRQKVDAIKGTQVTRKDKGVGKCLMGKGRMDADFFDVVQARTSGL